jgi:hypothetical protein
MDLTPTARYQHSSVLCSLFFGKNREPRARKGKKKNEKGDG